MKYTIEVIEAESEEEIIFRLHAINDNALKLINNLKSSQGEIIAYKGTEIYRLNPNDIYYFEVVDSKSFIYCENDVYESKLRLYEFEKLCNGAPFFRGSKSMVINSDKIRSLKPSLSGRFEISLINNERLIVSRQYVNSLKKLMGL